MYPCVVLGYHVVVNGPASVAAVPHVEPPFVDLINPTLSWQVEQWHYRDDFGDAR